MALLLGLPLIVFLTLRSFAALDIVVGDLAFHFYVVSTVAAITLVLAVAVVVSARRLPDARTFFLAAGFLVMAVIFFAHGAATSPWLAIDGGGATTNPFAAYARGSAQDDDHSAHADGEATGSSRDRSRLVGLSSSLSLAASAPFFALAVLNLRKRIADFIVRWWTALFVIVTAPAVTYSVLALAFPSLLGWVPVSDPVMWLAAWAACFCLALACWRCFQAYRLALLPLQGTMALAMALLIESQLFLVTSPVGHLSWWEYHAALLGGFFAPVVAFLWQYRQTGDLGVVVEGLFLREQIPGLRRDDPRALGALVAAVAAKDNETADHVERVSDLAVAIAQRLGLPEERVGMVRWAGRLHDVGKIGVPNSILLKPGKLTPSEYDTMKLHTVRGWSIALRSRTLEPIAPIIRAHHERMDGKGYPDGLEGEAIPIEARIVATADFWDALTGDRPYRRGMTPDKAAEIIRSETGTHLDPRCVDALFAELGHQGMGSLGLALPSAQARDIA